MHVAGAFLDLGKLSDRVNYKTLLKKNLKLRNQRHSMVIIREILD